MTDLRPYSGEELLALAGYVRVLPDDDLSLGRLGAMGNAWIHDSNGAPELFSPGTCAHELFLHFPEGFDGSFRGFMDGLPALTQASLLAMYNDMQWDGE